MTKTRTKTRKDELAIAKERHYALNEEMKSLAKFANTFVPGDRLRKKAKWHTSAMGFLKYIGKDLELSNIEVISSYLGEGLGSITLTGFWSPTNGVRVTISAPINEDGDGVLSYSPIESPTDLGNDQKTLLSVTEMTEKHYIQLFLYLHLLKQ